MDNIGAEVGQKMRSAIKAKLLELNCYVDDELPDYIMVMVANRRTKAQMNEDLTLFLNTKTEAFVEWLHIVLKKLKEVTVTNPEVYKRVTKRKSSEQNDIKVKKEKKSKKVNDNIKKEVDASLTDNLLITPHKSSEHRKITLVNENRKEDKISDEFDIPLLSEVNTSSEKDLEEIERKIRNVKSRLGILVESESEEAKNPEKVVEHIEKPDSIFADQTSSSPDKQRRHSPITFKNNEKPPKKPSVLQRLGERVPIKRLSDEKEKRTDYKKKEDRFSRDRYSDREDRRHRRERNRSDDRKSREKYTKSRRESPESPKNKSRNDKNTLSQLGVMSKIHVPEKPPEEPDHEDELRTREVRSMVQVKPRVLSLGTSQPNKNLLLKAVAEANRSVSQTTNIKPLEKSNGEIPITRKLSHREKVKLRNIILAQVSREDSDSNDEDKEFEYVPKPLTKRSRTELPEYVPSSRQSVDEMEPEIPVKPRISAKARLEGRRSPSPIIFEKKKSTTKVSNKVEIPDNLPIIHPSISVKNKERCKYWPNCRQGDKCEFIHPVLKCEMFPNCQYGDKCLYMHPSCKFGPACTKRDCTYTHFLNTVTNKAPVTQPQICKYFPKCINNTCPFYHPKMCRFGKYCKNQADCTFSHIGTVNKSSLTWRSKV